MVCCIMMAKWVQHHTENIASILGDLLGKGCFFPPHQTHILWEFRRVSQYSYLHCIFFFVKTKCEHVWDFSNAVFLFFGCFQNYSHFVALPFCWNVRRYLSATLDLLSEFVRSFRNMQPFFKIYSTENSIHKITPADFLNRTSTFRAIEIRPLFCIFNIKPWLIFYTLIEKDLVNFWQLSIRISWEIFKIAEIFVTW